MDVRIPHPGSRGGSPRSWLGGDDDLGTWWMQGCGKGPEPLTPTFPVFLSGSPFPPLLCPLNTEQTVEPPSSPERPGASSDGRVAPPTELTGTAHTNSYAGHTALLLNPSAPKVVARVQPSLSDSRTTLSPHNLGLPCEPDGLAVIRTQPGGRLTNRVTAHLRPEHPALSLPPRAPLSCPQPLSGSPHSLLRPLLSAPVCTSRRVSASLTRCVSWEHGWYLGTRHPWPHSPVPVSAGCSP